MTYLARRDPGQYESVEHSLAFPELPVAWLNEALTLGLTQGQRAAANEIRRRVAAGRGMS